MTPAAVRMVLVEGADADGVTVDHLSLSGSVEQVVAAILGTRESAIDGGHRLVNVGVAWTDHAAAARLREALRPLDIAEVTLVSELHAASSLAVAIGRKTDCRRIALLFVEQDLATLAVVQTSDGAVVRVSSRSLSDAEAVEDVLVMVAALENLADPPQAVFVVGAGAAADTLAARLTTATTLPVQRPDDAELALARGAALACASAPRFDAETVGLGSDFGWASENLKPDAVAPIDAGPDPHAGTEAGPTLLAESGWALGYSAQTTAGPAPAAWTDPSVGHTEGVPEVRGEDTLPGADGDRPAERPVLLLGSALTTLFVVGFMALVISLVVTIRPAVDSRPAENVTGGVPGTPETIRAPLPVVQEAPRAVVMPLPAPEAAPAAPPLPAAPVPAPAAPALPPAASPAAAPAPPAQVPGPAVTAPQVLVPELIAALLPPVVAVPSGAAPGPRYSNAPAAPGTSVAATATQPSTTVPTTEATTAPTTTVPTTTVPTTTVPTTTVPTTATQTTTTAAQNGAAQPGQAGAAITSEQSATGIPAGTSTAVQATASASVPQTKSQSTAQPTSQPAGARTAAPAPPASAAPPPASRCAGLPDCPA